MDDLEYILQSLSGDTVWDKLAQAESSAISSAGMKDITKLPPTPAPPEPMPVAGQTPAPRMPTLNADVKLTKSQIDFAKFIRTRNGIGIAAWKAGSGKTLGTIVAFLNLKAEGNAGKAIVLVPASLRANFAENGVAKFTNATFGIIGTKAESTANAAMDVSQMGDRDFYIISHSMFRSNPDKYLAITGADTIIMDEMHRIKDPNSALNDVIEKVGQKVKNFIGATATPAMNKPFEAIELRNAISKPSERLSEAKFVKNFIKRAPSSFFERVQGWFGGEHTGEITGFTRKEELEKILAKSFHFAEPKVKGMPRKDVEVVEVPMDPRQEQNYHGILKRKLTRRERRILERAELRPDKELVPILNKIMAIRQLSNDAKFVEGGSQLSAAESSPKILRMTNDLVGHLKKNERGQIVIYSNFIGSGTRLIEARIKQLGIPYGVYYGKGQKGVTGKGREQAVRDYNAGKLKVLILSGAGAEGLNLPNTTMHMTMDPHYNPEKITQQEARGIRRGGQKYLPPQRRRVLVKRYVSVPNRGFSIDKSIYQIAAKKKALVDQLTALGLASQKARASQDPGRRKALKFLVQDKQIPLRAEESMRKVAFDKFARGGGYRSAHGSLEHGQVRLISDNSLTTTPTMAAGGNTSPYWFSQDHLPGTWSKKKKSEAEGKKSHRIKFKAKTEGNLGPNEESGGRVRLGY